MQRAQTSSDPFWALPSLSDVSTSLDASHCLTTLRPLEWNIKSEHKAERRQHQEIDKRIRWKRRVLQFNRLRWHVSRPLRLGTDRMVKHTGRVGSPDMTCNSVLEILLDAFHSRGLHVNLLLLGVLLAQFQVVVVSRHVVSVHHRPMLNFQYSMACAAGFSDLEVAKVPANLDANLLVPPSLSFTHVWGSQSVNIYGLHHRH